MQNPTDKNNKRYLQIILGITLFSIFITLITGGRIGLLIYIFVVYFIYSLISVSKAMKTEIFTKQLTSPQHKIGKRGWILISLVAGLLLISSIVFDASRGMLFSPQKNNQPVIETQQQ
ncbi:MAG: hypothetical protein WCP97_08020 [bacterium]